tara:strand:- start:3 stop:293 length:291 start_codon:yes stop_codon:yes gene_type:complete
MAKRKTPKVKDLRPEKINEQQLAKLQSHIKTIDQLTMQIGHVEMQKYHTLKGMESVQQTIEILRAEFIKDYGTDNINIQDGTIAYPEENGEINQED